MRIKATPIKLVFEILGLGPLNLTRVLFGENRFELLNHDEVTQALKSQYSLLRWADGETALARGKSIGYQQKSPDLAVKLKSALKKSEKEILIGIPPANFESLFNGKWNLLRLKIMFSTRVYLSKHISLHSQNRYCSTFYWYDVYSNLPGLLQEIKQKRPALLIAGNSDCLKVCPIGTEYIQTQLTDAYKNHSEIEKEIDRWVDSASLEFPAIKPLILVACGPYSKALVNKYAAVAQVVDVGHGFNFHLAGTAKYSWDGNP